MEGLDATGDVECGVVQFDAHHFAVGEEFRESEGGSAGAAAEIEKALADESLARKVGEYLPLDGADDVCGVLMAGKTVAEPGKNAFLKEKLDDFDGEGGFAGAELNECSVLRGWRVTRKRPSGRGARRTLPRGSRRVSVMR